MKQNKKNLSLLLAVILILGLFPVNSYADAYEPLINAVAGNYTIAAVDSAFEISGNTIVVNNGTITRQTFMTGLTVAGGSSYKLVSSENYTKFLNTDLTFAALPDKANADLIVNNDRIIVYIPQDAAFPASPDASNVAVYKIKTTASTNIINNGKLRFGNGVEDSINNKGGLQQPFYFNAVWKQLTFSNYPLNYAISINSTAAVLDSALTGVTYDYTTLANGSGIAIGTGDLTVDGKLLGITNRYELGANASYIKIKTTVQNKSDTEITNVKYWTGTQDDYVGGTDVPSKIKGNLVNGAFVDLTAMDQQAKALKIYTGSESVLFFSTHPNTEMILNQSLGFGNIILTDPRTSSFSMTGDNSYGMIIPMGTVAAGASVYFEWYYAAGSAADITTITEDLDEEANTSSNDATLSALVPSTGTLAPAFDAATTGYSFTVPTNISSINLTATRNQAAATMTLNGQAITSGVASQDVSLSYGSNTLTLVVTAEDGTTTKTYSITITRTAPPEEWL